MLLHILIEIQKKINQIFPIALMGIPNLKIEILHQPWNYKLFYRIYLQHFSGMPFILYFVFLRLPSEETITAKPELQASLSSIT